MEISPRKTTKRVQEPIDEWLQNEGYFRKHAPRDPTCLFRAVSEQVYMTQYYHIRVRTECVEFMRKARQLFQEDVPIPFDDYLEQMACFTEWGSLIEIQAMSLLYKKEFVIFNSQNQASRIVTNNGFRDVIYLCHTPQKQYESVYPRDFVANAAFCQSIVYQMLYKDVFKMPDIEITVHKMLHDRTATFRHDKFFMKGNLEIREQLASEIFENVDVKNETSDPQQVLKTIPPFPYRIAKAIDPNIYRNTDFDIWHEIRREVKSAGWTRYNSHELQIGGKCLVEVDFNEGEFDKANNNNVYLGLDRPSANSDGKTPQRKGKDSTFYYGHIQEMSKDQGPVLVFIEELGEKRTVPYSALKPLPLKKNKQANWLPICKRNSLLDSSWYTFKVQRSLEIRKKAETFSAPCSCRLNPGYIRILSLEVFKATLKTTKEPRISRDYCWIPKYFAKLAKHVSFISVDQKWKKTCGVASRKVNKDSSNANPPTTSTDKNENTDNIASDINANSYQWDEGSLKVDNSQAYESYPAEKCADFTLDNSIQTFASEMVHDDAQPSAVDIARQENNKERKAKGSFAHKNAENNSIRNLKPDNAPSHSVAAVSDDSTAAFDAYRKQEMPNEVYYPPYSGDATAQVDYMLRSINCSVQKSFDVNGTDLPLSDPFTLRFFYNLGLEYFRGGSNWNYLTNGQSAAYGQWYPGVPLSEEETANITGMMQDCTLAQQRAEYDNNQKEMAMQFMCQENTDKTVNGVKGVPRQKTEFPKRGDTSSYQSREKAKENAFGNKNSRRLSKNGLGPRFKKNSDNRHRSPQFSTQQPGPKGNGKPAKLERDPKGSEGRNNQDPRSVSHQAATSANAVNAYQASYVQQGVYSGLPYYSNEAEAFANSYYPPNPGFIPFPCLPATEIPDNNNLQPFPPHMCSGIDYSQVYPGLCPPYVCSSPAPYNVPPQNMPEQWYAVAGQPHPYMPYAPVLPLPTDASCNGIEPNVISNAS